MERLLRQLDTSGRWAPEASAETLVLSLLLAFVLGQLVAWTYLRTRTGVALTKKELRQSRAFPQSLVLMTIVVTLVMYVIGNNIVAAFGLLGALAIVRFRNVLPETRDTVFVFFVLVQGIAIGSQRDLAAIGGTLAFVLVVLYLHYTAFGATGRREGQLRLKLSPSVDEADVDGVLERFCRKATRVGVRQTEPELVEHTFEIKLRKEGIRREMLDELRGLAGVSDVSLVVRDEMAEA